MLTNKELQFTESFLATLKLYDFNEFPIGTEQFENGLKKLASGILNEAKIDKVFKYKIDSLFSRSPVSGSYTQFISALNYLNGRSLSFENPHFVKAKIKITENEAKKILEKNSDKDLRDLIESSARLFAEGASLRASK